MPLPSLPSGMAFVRVLAAVPLCAAILVACEKPSPHAGASADPKGAPTPGATGAATLAASSGAVPSASTTAGTAAAKTPPDPKRYPWLEDGTKHPPAEGSLVDRFAAPAGFTRVKVAAGSFGEYLRTLPVAAPGTPVLSFRGDVLREGTHPHVAAVVAIDVGGRDLQQCADSIVRLHAEWRRASGRGDVSYKAFSGFEMPYARYRKGDRFHEAGNDLAWSHDAKEGDSRESFRKYLDAVFTYANTVALARDAKKVERDQLAPGDFFVQGGTPGHAVIVLDLVEAKDGKRKALLGQGFMPAQNFHVLRGDGDDAWFSLDAATIATPFWEPFAWASARRLE